MAKPMPVQWRLDQVPQEFLDLRDQITKLPMSWRDKLLTLCERVGHLSQLQSKLVHIAQEAVDQLQLDVKYLMFDVEATRRERDELKEILEAIEEESD